MHIYNTKLTTCKRNTYNLCDMYNDCEKQLRTKQEKESAINLETYQLLAIMSACGQILKNLCKHVL